MGISFILGGMLGIYMPAHKFNERQKEADEFIFNTTITPYKCSYIEKYGTEYNNTILNNISCNTINQDINNLDIGTKIMCGNGPSCQGYRYINCVYSATLYISTYQAVQWLQSNLDTVNELTGLTNAQCTEGNFNMQSQNYKYQCSASFDLNKLIVDGKLETLICIDRDCNLLINIPSASCDKTCSIWFNDEFASINIGTCNSIYIGKGIETTSEFIITNEIRTNCGFNDTQCVDSIKHTEENSLKTYYYDTNDPLATYSLEKQTKSYGSSMGLTISGGLILGLFSWCLIVNISKQDDHSRNIQQPNIAVQQMHVVSINLNNINNQNGYAVNYHIPAQPKEEVKLVVPEEAQTECTICMNDFTEEDKNLQKTLECFHIFHTECINKWFLQKKECPICRHVITS
jgi:hypothetical protein